MNLIEIYLSTYICVFLVNHVVYVHIRVYCEFIYMVKMSPTFTKKMTLALVEFSKHKSGDLVNDVISLY